MGLKIYIIIIIIIRIIIIKIGIAQCTVMTKQCSRVEFSVNPNQQKTDRHSNTQTHLPIPATGIKIFG